MTFKSKLWMGLIFSLFPLYTFITWIYISNKFEHLSHGDAVKEYLALFPGFIQDTGSITLLEIIFAFAAIFIFGTVKRSETRAFNLIIIYMAVLVFILLYSIWGTL